MRKILLSTVLCAALLGPNAAFAAEKTVTLSVPGMTCASCPYIVEKTISAVKGVSTVKAALENRTATVTFDDDVTSLDAITQATASVGYKSSLVETTKGS